MASPRIRALRELSSEAELERKDFVYEATEQLRRFLDAQRDRLREIGPIKLVDDDQDYLIYHPVDETWTTRLTYQDPADKEWYDEEQVIDSVSEIVELYNPADIYAWPIAAAKDPATHLPPADTLAAEEALVDDEAPEEAEAEADAAPDWQAALPERQQEVLSAQRLWQLADTYRQQMQAQEKQTLWEFSANAEEVLGRTGHLQLLDEDDDVLILRHDGRFETSLDLSDVGRGVGGHEPEHPGLTVADARVIADYYDPADVLQWVTDALSQRYPGVDFSAVYE
ncbi:MAG: hypothetical protein M3295_03170 [Chloroflexota bacterium]|nr:hypothetical protein [Chloroflexota bacterium]